MPVGFIEIDKRGARFKRIDTPVDSWIGVAEFAFDVARRGGGWLFDAVKPGPVAWADDLFHGFGWRGGFGIIFDDLVAAFCTLLVIAAWRAW